LSVSRVGGLHVGAPHNRRHLLRARQISSRNNAAEGLAALMFISMVKLFRDDEQRFEAVALSSPPPVMSHVRCDNLIVWRMSAGEGEAGVRLDRSERPILTQLGARGCNCF
jgi:hypothetical protein